MKYNNVQLLSVKSFDDKVRSTLSIKMWEEQKTKKKDAGVG
jgi:hypothetical protein